MAFVFHLPDIGEGLTEATIVRWLVSVGDDVAVDQPFVEVETDKAVVEIPAPQPGTVLHLGVDEGESLSVGDVLVVIGKPGEEWQHGDEQPSEPVRQVAASPIVGTLEEADAPAPSSLPADLPEAGPLSSGPGVRALPLVRRLAQRLGVDLAAVGGTGPGGRITREDVEAAAQTGSGERVRMSPTRRAIARNLARSWREIPHVTTYASADAASLLERRRASAEELGMAVPLEALLAELVVPLLGSHREFNAVVDGDEVVYRDEISLGFAVDAPHGLTVAVVHGLGSLDLAEIAAEMVRLATAARDRTIDPAEMRGASFTVSNIGAVGGGFGTPIIPYGTSAILSVGRAAERPVVKEGKIVVGRELPLSLSYDHRIIDGAAGRAFMADLVAAIEQ